MTRAPDGRTSPLRRHILLWIGYALIVAAAIATVLLPELSEPPPEPSPPPIAESP